MKKQNIICGMSAVCAAFAVASSLAGAVEVPGRTGVPGVGQEYTVPAEGTIPLSREEFRRRVVDYSNQLKMSRENLAAAEFKVKKAKTGYYPSLGAQASFSYLTNQPMSFDIPGFSLKDYNYTTQLAIQQNVYTGHAVTNQTRAAQIERSIAEIQGEMTLENVVYSADLTYWSLSAAQQQRDITRIYVRIVDSLYSIVNTRFQDGYVSRTDLLMVETRLNEAKLQEIAAEKLFRSSLQNLNTLMGNLQPEGFFATDTIAQRVEMPGRVSLGSVLAVRPDYRIAQKRLDLSNQNIRLARAQYNPQFVVGFQGIYGTPEINLTGDGKLYGVAFAQLNMPIFRWNERRHSVNMARAAARSSQWALLDAENSVNGDLAVARSNMEQSYEQVKVAEANLNVALDNLILNTFSYSEGKLPILDVLSAQLAWIQSYTAFVNSNYNYKVSIADYYKAQGTLAQQVVLPVLPADR